MEFKSSVPGIKPLFALTDRRSVPEVSHVGVGGTGDRENISIANLRR